MAMRYTLNRHNYCWNSQMNYVDLDGKFPVEVAVLAVAAEGTMFILSICVMDEHYSRNKNQEEYFSQYTEHELIRMAQQGEDGWVEAPAGQNKYHRFTNGVQGEEALYNVKYLRELQDGTSYEMIICQLPGDDDDYIVKDPKNMGTYNYTNPHSLGEKIGHGWDDVVPYWFLSNTPDDGLAWYERLWGKGGEKKGTPDFKLSTECPNE